MYSEEVPVGFEPTIRELQSHALPLGYGTIFDYLSPEEPLSSPSRTRTYDTSVNSRMLYRLSY